MVKLTLTWSYLVVLFLLASSFAKIPTFSTKEKVAIDKLRNAVEHKLISDYMKSDAYFYKWLKAKRFDHSRALEALEKCLTWRTEDNIDSLPIENHGKLGKQYFLDFTTVRDREGLPVILLPFGDWDVRRKALEGKLSDLARRMDLLEEKGAQLGFNATGDPSAMFIADFQGVPFYVTSVLHHENYYPYNMHRMFTINTPSIFEPILRLLRPLMTDSTRIAYKSFGYDRADYSAAIGETVDLTILPSRFGGTMKSGKF